MAGQWAGRHAGLCAGPWLPRAAMGALLLLGIGLSGCGKKGISGELEVFKEGGRKVAEFSDIDASSLEAKKCQAGSIDNVAALLCEYKTPEAATKGQAAAESWFGETSTALVLRRELLILGLSDRNHVDPNGKAISAIAKIFRRVNKR